MGLVAFYYSDYNHYNGVMKMTATFCGHAQISQSADVEKWLYVPNFYSEYRYILGTRGKKPLICIGINPSTAAPEALDPTLQSVNRIALSNGYDRVGSTRLCPRRNQG